MELITRNEADFSEIFRHAEKNFGIEWNKCCDIFHSTEFMNQDGKPSDYVLAELEKNIVRDHEFWKKPEIQTAAKVVISFMKEHNVTEMRVVYD